MTSDMENSIRTRVGELKEIGLKATVPRIKVLEVFERSQARHLSAEDVYKSLLKVASPNECTCSEL